MGKNQEMLLKPFLNSSNIKVFLHIYLRFFLPFIFLRYKAKRTTRNTQHIEMLVLNLSLCQSAFFLFKEIIAGHFYSAPNFLVIFPFFVLPTTQILVIIVICIRYFLPANYHKLCVVAIYLESIFVTHGVQLHC